MNLPAIVTKAGAAVKSATRTTKLFCITHKSEILLGGGITCYIISEIGACKATLKARDVMDEYAVRVELLPQDVNVMKTLPSGETVLDDDAYNKQLRKIKRECRMRIAKGYILPVVFGIAGIGGCIGSHIILSNELASQAAAAAALAEGWRLYRMRVIEREGAERDREYMCGKYMTEAIDADTGKITQVVADFKDEKGPIECTTSRLFAKETSTKFSDSYGENQRNLSRWRWIVNDTLTYRGYIFFDEVLEVMGMQPEAGDHDIGWVKLSPATYISFGLDDLDDPMKEGFKEGWEPSVWLDFNVQGDIRYIYTEEYRNRKEKGWMLE